MSRIMETYNRLVQGKGKTSKRISKRTKKDGSPVAPSWPDLESRQQEWFRKKAVNPDGLSDDAVAEFLEATRYQFPELSPAVGITECRRYMKCGANLRAKTLPKAKK